MWTSLFRHARQAWLVLLLSAVLAGMLAVFDQGLQGRIQANAEARLNRAILEVVPSGASSAAETLAGHAVYRVDDAAGQIVGWAVPAESLGFQDRIRLLIGFSGDGRRILGLAVLESRETPGLGEKIRDADFREQFNDRETAAAFDVIKPGQTAPQPIHAITGATISSQAVTSAVNEQLAWVPDAVAARNQPTLRESP